MARRNHDAQSPFDFPYEYPSVPGKRPRGLADPYEVPDTPAAKRQRTPLPTKRVKSLAQKKPQSLLRNGGELQDRLTRAGEANHVVNRWNESENGRAIIQSGLRTVGVPDTLQDRTLRIADLLQTDPAGTSFNTQHTAHLFEGGLRDATPRVNTGTGYMTSNIERTWDNRTSMVENRPHRHLSNAQQRGTGRPSADNNTGGTPFKAFPAAIMPNATTKIANYPLAEYSVTEHRVIGSPVAPQIRVLRPITDGNPVGKAATPPTRGRPEDVRVMTDWERPESPSPRVVSARAPMVPAMGNTWQNDVTPVEEFSAEEFLSHTVYNLSREKTPVTMAFSQPSVTLAMGDPRSKEQAVIEVVSIEEPLIHIVGVAQPEAEIPTQATSNEDLAPDAEVEPRQREPIVNEVVYRDQPELHLGGDLRHDEGSTRNLTSSEAPVPVIKNSRQEENVAGEMGNSNSETNGTINAELERLVAGDQPETECFFERRISEEMANETDATVAKNIDALDAVHLLGDSDILMDTSVTPNIVNDHQRPADIEANIENEVGNTPELIQNPPPMSIANNENEMRSTPVFIDQTPLTAQANVEAEIRSPSEFIGQQPPSVEAHIETAVTIYPELNDEMQSRSEVGIENETERDHVLGDPILGDPTCSPREMDNENESGDALQPSNQTIPVHRAENEIRDPILTIMDKVRKDLIPSGHLPAQSETNTEQEANHNLCDSAHKQTSREPKAAFESDVNHDPRGADKHDMVESRPCVENGDYLISPYVNEIQGSDKPDVNFERQTRDLIDGLQQDEAHATRIEHVVVGAPSKSKEDEQSPKSDEKLSSWDKVLENALNDGRVSGDPDGNLEVMDDTMQETIDDSYSFGDFDANLDIETTVALEDLQNEQESGPVNVETHSDLSDCSETPDDWTDTIMEEGVIIDATNARAPDEEEEVENEISTLSNSFSWEARYEVDSIKDHRLSSNGKAEFLVKWKDNPNNDSTWESEEDVLSFVPEMLYEYIRPLAFRSQHEKPADKITRVPPIGTRIINMRKKSSKAAVSKTLVKGSIGVRGRGRRHGGRRMMMRPESSGTISVAGKSVWLPNSNVKRRPGRLRKGQPESADLPSVVNAKESRAENQALSALENISSRSSGTRRRIVEESPSEEPTLVEAELFLPPSGIATDLPGRQESESNKGRKKMPKEVSVSRTTLRQAGLPLVEPIAESLQPPCDCHPLNPADWSLTNTVLRVFSCYRVCPYCGYRTDRSGNLRIHLTGKHKFEVQKERIGKATKEVDSESLEISSGNVQARHDNKSGDELESASPTRYSTRHGSQAVVEEASEAVPRMETPMSSPARGVKRAPGRPRKLHNAFREESSEHTEVNSVVQESKLSQALAGTHADLASGPLFIKYKKSMQAEKLLAEEDDAWETSASPPPAARERRSNFRRKSRNSLANGLHQGGEGTPPMDASTLPSASTRRKMVLLKLPKLRRELQKISIQETGADPRDETTVVEDAPPTVKGKRAGKRKSAMREDSPDVIEANSSGETTMVPSTYAAERGLGLRRKSRGTLVLDELGALEHSREMGDIVSTQTPAVKGNYRSRTKDNTYREGLPEATDSMETTYPPASARESSPDQRDAQDDKAHQGFPPKRARGRPRKGTNNAHESPRVISDVKRTRSVPDLTIETRRSSLRRSRSTIFGESPRTSPPAATASEAESAEEIRQRMPRAKKGKVYENFLKSRRHRGTQVRQKIQVSDETHKVQARLQPEESPKISPPAETTSSAPESTETRRGSLGGRRNMTQEELPRATPVVEPTKAVLDFTVKRGRGRPRGSRNRVRLESTRATQTGDTKNTVRKFPVGGVGGQSRGVARTKLSKNTLAARIRTSARKNRGVPPASLREGFTQWSQVDLDDEASGVVAEAERANEEASQEESYKPKGRPAGARNKKKEYIYVPYWSRKTTD